MSAPGGGLRRRFRLDTLTAVRHEVDAYVRSFGLSESRRYGFVVAVNELMTNAIRHGGGAGELLIWAESAELRCRVTDRGPGIDPARGAVRPRPEPGSIGGLGLWLARQASDDLEITGDSSGTDVTLRFRMAA